MSEGSSTPPAKSDRVLRSQSRPTKSEEPSSNEEEKDIKSPTISPQGKAIKKRKRSGINEVEAKEVDKPIKIRKNGGKVNEGKDTEESSTPEVKKSSNGTAMSIDGSTGPLDVETLDGALTAEELAASIIPEILPDATVMDDTEGVKEDKTPDSTQGDPGLMDHLYSLRNTLAVVLSKMPKSPGSTSTQVWGTLVSQSPLQPNVTLSGSSFSVGRNARCNLVLKDSVVPSILFKLHNVGNTVVLESPSSSAILSVNNRNYRKGSKVILKNGDEINVMASKPYTFVFQQQGKLETGVNNPQIVSPTRLSNSKNSPSGKPTDPVSPPIAYMTRSRKRTPSSTPNNGNSKSPSVVNTNNTTTSTDETMMTDADGLNETANQLSKENLELKKQFKQDFAKSFIDSNDIQETFDKFPYYLSDNVRQLLVNSAFVYLMKPDYVKYISDLPQSRKILLSGPSGTEIYQEYLVRALAKHFKATLVIIDSSTLEYEKPVSDKKEKGEDDSDFWEPLEIPTKPSKSKFKRNEKSSKYAPPHGTLGRLLRHGLASTGTTKIGDYKGKVMITFDENPRKVGLKFDKSLSDVLGDDGHNILVDASDLKHDYEDRYDVLMLEALFEALNESKGPTILLVKEAETTLMSNYDRYVSFKKEISNINTPLIVIGSTVAAVPTSEKGQSSGGLFSKTGSHHAFLDLAFFDHIARVEERSKEPSKVSKLLLKLFTNRIAITQPTETEQLTVWTKQISADTENLKLAKNLRNINKVLQKNAMECGELKSPELSKQIIPMESVEKVVGWAVSNHLMNEESLDLKEGKLRISETSIDYGLTMLKNTEPDSPLQKSLRDVECENEFERKLLPEVIPPSELDIKFEDIGALDEVKQIIKELVMLPLQRPELFAKGSLTRPCKGILLFGPPGTGKTMLAKAVASQSGANFINISMSTIASKWFGEGEKYVKGVFTLASKISPTVIFIDEVDSILGKRERPGEHEAMRKIKNEFMSNWDGLKTKDKERVLVLAATNRPFDLDDAVLRRLSRRLLVDLPNVENRIKILKVILAKEDLVPQFNYDALATMTEGFSGSDLKNLCVAAAYQPIREILAEEKAEEERAREEREKSGKMEEDLATQPKKKEIILRPLTLKDFEKSVKEISASVSEDAFSIAELRKWNEMYGEGGNRKKESLSYFM